MAANTTEQPRTAEDIFIGYARPEREKARVLAEALQREGYTVWWDTELVPGDRFRQVIEEKLGTVRCVVVLWSRLSLRSDFVVDEAEKGKRRGILVPVLIEKTEPPLGHQGVQAASLIGWRGETERPDYQSFLKAVRAFVGGPSAARDRPLPPRGPAPPATPQQTRERRQRWIPLVAGAAAVVAVILALRLLGSGRGEGAPRILSPRNGSAVPAVADVSGRAAALRPGDTLWILVHSPRDGAYFPHGDLAAILPDGTWSASNVQIGGRDDAGRPFRLLLVRIDAGARRDLEAYAARADRAGLEKLPSGAQVLDQIEVRRSADPRSPP